MEDMKFGFICFGEINTSIEKLKIKHDSALTFLKNNIKATFIDAGIVVDDDNYITGKKAVEILNKNNDFSCLIICMAGWIPTHAVIEVIDEYRHIPMLLWGLCGDKNDGHIVTTAEQAGTSALKPVLEDMGYSYKFVYNSIGLDWPIEKIKNFLYACNAKKALRRTKTCTVGYRDMLLYGTQYEASSVRRVFGIEVESMEMLEMVRETANVTDDQIDKVANLILKKWNLEVNFPYELLKKGIRYALSLGEKIKDRGYKAITINDVDGMKKLEGFPPAIVFMILNYFYDVETTPENDVIGNITQLMMKYLTGETAPYMEYYEFFKDSMLIGVPDYVPVSVIKGPVKIIPTSFGLLDKSLLNVSEVKTGYVTCSRLVYKKGKYFLHVYTGEAKTPPKWEEFGWEDPAPQLSSLEVFPDSCSVDEFAQKVCSQHVIVSYGNNLERIKDLCDLLGIEIIN